MEHEAYCTPRKIAMMYPGTHAEYEIRALTRKSVSPLPSLKRGSKRPVTVIKPSVYELYLQYEQGLINYGEVVTRAKRDIGAMV